MLIFVDRIIDPNNKPVIRIFSARCAEEGEELYYEQHKEYLIKSGRTN